MKRQLLILTAMMAFLFSSAQMSVQKPDGTVFVDGDVYSFNTYDSDDSKLHFSVFNTSATENITVKVLCETLTNTDGFDFQFCFGGNCMPFVIQGQNYPATGYTIAAGQNSGDSDFFWNQKAVSTTGIYPMVLKFKFYMVDGNGDAMGAPVSVSYRYDGLLGVQENALQTTGVFVRNTNVKDIINIESKISTEISVVDLSGKLLMTNILVKGNNAINLNSLKTGMYILSYKDVNGKISSNKILKK